MVLLRWGSSKARGFFVGVCAGVVCQVVGPLDEGDPAALVLHVLASPPENEVHDGFLEASPWGGEVQEGLDGELGLAHLEAVPVHEGFQGLPWRAGRRSLGLLMVLGVRWRHSGAGRV